MAKTITRRRFFSLLAVSTLATLVAACGRKNAPKHPDGSDYPRKYPYDNRS